MSQIDQAFIKAYAQNRARASSPVEMTPQSMPQPRTQPAAAPIATSTAQSGNVSPIQTSPLQQSATSIPLASPSNGNNLFAHAPSSIAPHHASVTPTHPTASYPTARSALASGPQTISHPPELQPTTPATVQTANPKMSRPEPSIHTTSAASRQRSSSTVRIDPPVAPAPADPTETSLQTTRKTLSSYFQQSRGNVDLAPPPAILTIPTRWNKNDPQASRSDPSPMPTPLPMPTASKPSIAPIDHVNVHASSNQQVFNDSVDRGSEYNAWQFHVVERGVKSNSTSDGPSAKIRNPGKPNSFIRIDRPHRETHETNPFTRPFPTPVQPFGSQSEQVPSPPTMQSVLPQVAQPTPQSSVPHSAGYHSTTPAPSHVAAEAAAYHYTDTTTPTVAHVSSQPTPQTAPAKAESTETTYIHTPAPKSFSKAASTKPLVENIAKLALPVTPTWEVDEFLWPATVAGLMQNQPDAIRDIGLHLQHAASKGLRTLAITSGERGVGRSTVAMCIAKAVSKAGLRVALVDCDYECPSLVDQLNLEVAHGWQECILENVPLDEVAVHAVKEKITFFPSLGAWSNSQVEQHQIRINKLLKRIALGYDLVILDCNRIHGKQQTLCGLGDEQVVDAALVIVDAQLSLRQRVDGAIETLRRNNINSIGIAENFHSQG
jgi:Mrp family chromosome partitioning ATPase